MKIFVIFHGSSHKIGKNTNNYEKCAINPISDKNEAISEHSTV